MEASTYYMKKIGYMALLCILFNIYNINSQIRMTKVDPFTDQVTIHNFGTTMVPLSGYYFCTKISYGSFATATLISGSLDLAPNANVTLVVNTTAGLDNVASDLSIYFTNAGFGTATNMVDFMQYGDDFPVGLGREPQAVSQGLWTAGTFILGDPAPWSYTGSDGTQNGVEFWVSSSTLSINNEEFNSEVSLYPNPVKEIINIKKLEQVNLLNASIFDISGRLIKSAYLNNNLTEKIIDLSSIQSGLYVLKISDTRGRVLTKKLVKE